MKESRYFSDEILNAYLDDELDQDEKKRLVEALQHDDILNQRLCRLGRVRSMLQIAYHDIAAPQSSTAPNRPKTPRFYAVAAVLALLIGLSIGWFANQSVSGRYGLQDLAQQIQLNNANAAAAQPWRVLMHLTSDDPQRLAVVLDETEALLKEYERIKRPVHMQILANGPGLKLLRRDTSNHAKRIQQLQQQYKNLVFVACATALKRIETEHKIKVHLLPDIEITPSALGEVLRKQGEGWTYIRI